MQNLNDILSSLKKTPVAKSVQEKMDCVKIAYELGRISGEKSSAQPEEKEELDLTNPEFIPEDQIIQNRDRGTSASILQMASISANPDFMRLSGTRDFGAGAPVIAYGNIPKSQLGKVDTAILSDGSKIKVQYAVINATEVLTSNNADGSTIEEFYSNDTSKPRAIAGNGRIAGIRAAYEKDTAKDYKASLIQEASNYQLNGKAIEKMSSPILVRVMQPKDVTADIGDKSNTIQNIQMNKIEEAHNDTKRLDLKALPLNANNEPTIEALNNFIKTMPLTEQAGLIDQKNKRPNLACLERVQNAIFVNTYDVPVDPETRGGVGRSTADDLLSTKVESIDPDDQVITGALYLAAPAMQKLKGLKNGFDIRDIVVKAAYQALEAKKNKNTTVQTAAANMNFFESQDTSGAMALLTRVFVENKRSKKACADKLIQIATRLFEESQYSDSNLFADPNAPTATEVIRFAMNEANEKQPPKQETPSGGGLFDSVEMEELLTPAQRAFWNSDWGYIVLDSIVSDRPFNDCCKDYFNDNTNLFNQMLMSEIKKQCPGTTP